MTILEGVKKTFKGIFVAIICAVLIGLILWPFGYKVLPVPTIFKILDKFVVFKKINEPPNLHLFSQYPYEYNLTDPNGLIDDQEMLTIKEETKPLWLGLFNSGNRTLHNVRFILFSPKESEFYNKNEWQDAWLIAQFGKEQKTQCDYKYPANIAAKTGWVIPVPIQFKFPSVGEYSFKYVVFCDEYEPFKKSFILKKVENK